MKKLKYSASLITQGSHKFFSLTMPSDVLSRCTFVSTRDENPKEGFQRMLDKKRAQAIADYIDNGLGTIPSSIILSAQSSARFSYDSKNKTLEFLEDPKAFLILDGQHRIYGFGLAKSSLRVPVVIYSDLTRKNETRLFIDINSKQKGVSNELLLDIKNLAEYENNEEKELRDIYNKFMSDTQSVLYNKLSPTAKSKSKLSRVTFNSGVKPLLKYFQDRDYESKYQILNSYFFAFWRGLRDVGADENLVNSTLFKSITAFFPEVAQRLKDKHGDDFSVDNFYSILKPIFSNVRVSKFLKPGNSYSALVESFVVGLKSNLVI